jgi:hypothetical protein
MIGDNTFNNLQSLVGLATACKGHRLSLYTDEVSLIKKLKPDVIDIISV